MAVVSKDTRFVEADITAENTFTDGIYVEDEFNFSISGTFSATVTVQRSFDGGSTWRDTDTFTAATETFGSDPGKEVVYRAGVKTGDFTSGTASIRIGR